MHALYSVKASVSYNFFTGKFVHGKESGTVYKENTVNKTASYASHKEDFSGRGFSLGALFRKIGAWIAFGVWGKCLKPFRISDKVKFQNTSARIAYCNELSHIKFVYGKVCIRNRIRNRKYSEQTYFICLAKGRFPGKKVFFGGFISEKMGLGKLLGEVF